MPSALSPHLHLHNPHPSLSLLHPSLHPVLPASALDCLLFSTSSGTTWPTWGERAFPGVLPCPPISASSDSSGLWGVRGLQLKSLPSWAPRHPLDRWASSHLWGSLSKCLVGKSRKQEVMAAVGISPEPPDLRGGQFMLYSKARASLPPPTVPVSGRRTICSIPEEELLFELLSLGAPSLSLSFEAVLGGREGVPPYR